MKSWPELIGSGNPENGDYLAGLREAQREAKPMTMVERVALAIQKAELGNNWNDMARAAIEAMRKPTGGMWIAGDLLVLPSAGDWATDTMVVWQAMIDAALKE